MYDFLSHKFVSNIHFMFVSEEKVTGVAESLRDRFSKSVAVKGTKRFFHRFSPVDEHSLMAFEMSSAIVGKRARVSRF